MASKVVEEEFRKTFIKMCRLALSCVLVFEILGVFKHDVLHLKFNSETWKIEGR